MEGVDPKKCNVQKLQESREIKNVKKNQRQNGRKQRGRKYIGKLEENR
jgi:hypothetical protein